MMTLNINCPVSIVVPVFNEEDSIGKLLDLIAKQTLRPAEIIVVDTGSTDSTVERANSIVSDYAKGGYLVKVVSLLSGYPGLGRNVGVRQASQEWIAFLDAGIHPDQNWLEELWRCVQVSGDKLAYGLCEFRATTPVASAVCALSYGFGTRSPVIPSSLFHKSLFQEVGYFREDLRSYEDSEWNQRLLSRGVYTSKPICPNAHTVYQGFPDSLMSVFLKWKLYEAYACRSGVKCNQHIFYFLSISIALVVCMLHPYLIPYILVFYILLRVLMDSMWRSHSRLWWIKRPLSLAVLLPVAIFIDAGKLVGILVGVKNKISE